MSDLTLASKIENATNDRFLPERHIQPHPQHPSPTRHVVSRRPVIRVLQQLVHHVSIDIAQALMSKRLGQRADNRKPELLPQADGRPVGTKKQSGSGLTFRHELNNRSISDSPREGTKQKFGYKCQTCPSHNDTHTYYRYLLNSWWPTHTIKPAKTKNEACIEYTSIV